MSDTNAIVIVPVYNRAHLIERCLDSIMAQDYPEMQLVIVDNASTDATPQVISEWITRNSAAKRPIKFLCEPRRGAAVARQHGVEWVIQSGFAESSVLFFFDSDDTMGDGLIRRAMTEFNADAGTDIVCWRIKSHLSDGSVLSTKPNTEHPGIVHHIMHSFLSTQRYASRLGFFNTTGGWNPSVMVWDDYELGLRIMLRSPRIKVVNETLVNVYPQVESITGVDFSSKSGQWEEIMDLMSETIERSGRPDRNHLENAICYRRIILAAQYHIEGHRDLAMDLFHTTIKSPTLSLFHRIVLRNAFLHARLGLRGAYTLCNISGKLL